MHATLLLTESNTFTLYIDDMLQGLRNSTHGLTDDQARSLPTRSRLSIAGLIKHTTWVMRGTVLEKGAAENAGSSTEGIGNFFESFTPTTTESLADLLAGFDAARADYLDFISGLDPAGEYTVGPRPWDNRPDPEQANYRVLLAHHIDEFARHAGHADIIREEIDGAQAMPLKFAVEGRAGNEYVQPWTPNAPASAEGESVPTV
ncbi:MAG: DUF664 domain-containing protein [Propionibacteriaceae bacterium]|nr:DUF664 domain-containing protein [Propionibacteriaceae bacterium]